jgi:hypothetical protein
LVDTRDCVRREVAFGHLSTKHKNKWELEFFEGGEEGGDISWGGDGEEV